MSDCAPIQDPYVQAQKMGEDAYESLLAREDEEGECVCTTCIVREVLLAALPPMVQIARLEAAAVPAITPVLRSLKK